MAYLEVLGLFRLFGDSLGGEVHFNVINGFGMSLEVELTLVLVNVKGLGGGGGGWGAERTYGFKQIFPSDVDT